MNSNERTSLLPEWAPQQAVLMAWPHAGTDWAPMLDQALACYAGIAAAITADEDVVAVTPDVKLGRESVAHLPEAQRQRIHWIKLPTNDTWTRDYGPITVTRSGEPWALDFRFNAWGMKFAADQDNQVCRRLAELGLFRLPMGMHQDLVLEGGSIESDGNGTIMTTASCLLSRNRNDQLSRRQIEAELGRRLGARKVLWLEHGSIEGDDTDGHIDTLARFAPGNVILYAGLSPFAWPGPHSDEMLVMERQLSEFTNADQVPYKLMRLPAPRPMRDENGDPMPATYANFLVLNHRVLVPTYGQADLDQMAQSVIGQAFPGREVVGVDCQALIRQHGSLHCATMQLPEKTLTL